MNWLLTSQMKATESWPVILPLESAVHGLEHTEEKERGMADKQVRGKYALKLKQEAVRELQQFRLTGRVP